MEIEANTCNIFIPRPAAFIGLMYIPKRYLCALEMIDIPGPFPYVIANSTNSTILELGTMEFWCAI